VFFTKFKITFHIGKFDSGFAFNGMAMPISDGDLKIYSGSLS
jgi:hypothetical protein